MAPPPDAALLSALRAIQRGEPSHAAWAEVDRFVRTVLPSARDADARQATLLAIHRRVAGMDATTPASAAGWVRRIARRKKIDEARRQKRAPLSLVGAEGENLEVATEGGSGLALEEDRLGETLAEIEACLDRLLEERHAAPAARVVPRAQARARLFRTLGLSVPEIAEALALPEPPAEATLSKWIERGLPLLVEAIGRWQSEGSHRELLAEGLIARVEARRADAGRARPSRRRASVPRGPDRRRAVRPFPQLGARRPRTRAGRAWRRR